jgi:hypothetical protein
LILENLNEGLIGRLPLYKGGEGDLENLKNLQRKNTTKKGCPYPGSLSCLQFMFLYLKLNRTNFEVQFS